MKLILLFFFLCINYSLSQKVEEDASKKTVKLFPKKVRPSLLQYQNNGKYFYPAPHETVKKRRLNQKGYTVFPKPFPYSGDIQMNHQIVPDSPYFPMEKPELHERRSRVKKVLPEYTFSRQKRSTGDKDDRNKSKDSAQPNSKDVGKVKRLKSGGSGINRTRVKTLRAPVKLSSSNGAQVKKSQAAKKQIRASRIGKKRDPSNKTLSQTRHKRQKLSSLQNQKLKQKLSQPTVERSKKLKSTKNKKLPNRDPVQKKLKSRQRTLKLRNLNKKPQKELSQTQLNMTSKNRAVRSKDPDARRLIAGRDALIEDYPYTISIQKDKAHWCSGAILNPRLIITTANCVWRSKSISRMRVRAGSRHTSHGGQVTKIQEVMKHPGWKLRRNPENDIALALLDRNIRFSHGVHGVDLPNRVMMPPFDDAWITSWGTERRDGIFEPKSATLQVYHARLLERDKCNNVTQRFGVTVTENFICLAQTGRRAPCTRDTGAPAVSDGVLWGLASWGIRKLCGTERFPAMFSYIASQSNMDFIINATHFLMAEERSYPFLDRYPIKKFPVTTPEPMTLPY